MHAYTHPPPPHIHTHTHTHTAGKGTDEDILGGRKAAAVAANLSHSLKRQEPVSQDTSH